MGAEHIAPDNPVPVLIVCVGVMVLIGLASMLAYYTDLYKKCRAERAQQRRQRREQRMAPKCIMCGGQSCEDDLCRDCEVKYRAKRCVSGMESAMRQRVSTFPDRKDRYVQQRRNRTVRR